MSEQDRLIGLWPSQVAEAFQRMGYRVDRLTHGHWLLDHPSRPPIQIPYHGVRAVAPALMAAQLQRAGLTYQQFLAEL